ALQAAIILLALWWYWDSMTWVANWFDPESWPMRWLLFTVMLLGIAMSSAIPRAFADLAVVFVIGYLGTHYLSTAFIIVAARRQRPELAQKMVRSAVWLVASTPLWIAGALSSPDDRTPWWLAAIAIDYIGPRVKFWIPVLGQATAASWAVAPSHIAERTRLFIIIALGESVLIAGATFDGSWFELPKVAALVSAFVGTALMWLLYFNHTAENVYKFVKGASDTGLAATNTFSYLHLMIVAGIVVVAVGDELGLAHPEDPIDGATAVVVCGGAALYILGNLLVKRSVGYRWLRSHVIGIAVLLGALILFASPAASGITTLAAGWLVNLVLASVVLADEIVHRRDARGEESVKA
ncbi:MAG: low temperature requirement protein A, partial [Salinibacterium sp.]|nr:low temperature requirement protein A [Salinibacterium sp.]